ncbi:exonuclease, DNA polymerase III, epsilon subunit family [Archaeoglobus sulfaticallidus PM70-1]|uniref:Exonuclease, DNA polymerase III, epsilon subunit family n=1 Tax=Archaeoglobus sulfaticallidus PM70-1 TaxID=387631 RepID=N0BHQ2_9EURY|nr:3'-5' exonuclease [Archaeoglobus sulfaticallidus]AGK61842.1 exonuclease, DNA polymerase III, epsilon subunit family [Archaeoglobus sulfaticallidus PM70-1]
MNLRSARFSVIDLETTGLNVKRDEILSIAVVPMQGTKILSSESFHTYIKPKRYKLKSMRIHGIDPSTIENAPKFSEVSKYLFDLLRDTIIVGHAVEIDFSFLKKYFKNENMNLNNKYIDIAIVEKWLCERLGERKGNMDLTLDVLLKSYNLSGRFRHHALTDAFLTAQIFQIQLLKMLKYGMNSVERILSIMESSKATRIDFIF